MTTYTQTSIPDTTTIGSSSTDYIKGEKIADTDSVFYGKTPTDAQFYLKKENDPPSSTYTVSCVVVGDDSTIKHTFWTKDIADLPTVMTLTSESSIASTTALAELDCIAIKIDPSPSNTFLRFGVDFTDVFDGVHSVYTGRQSDGEMRGFDDADVGFSITVAAAPSSATTLFPPPYANIGLHGL